MEYKKIKEINEYKSESINPMKTPDTMYELYSVPFFTTGHPEYLHGSEIGSSKVIVQKNDILVCKINPRINRVWVVADESNCQSIASSEWIVVRNAQYNPYFLAWYFRTSMFQQLMTSEVTGIGGSLTRAQPKRVAEYPVPVLPRERQDEIASILGHLQSIKYKRKNELDLLDSLVKARFVESFGALVKNVNKYPEHILGDDIEFLTSGSRGWAKYYSPTGKMFITIKNVKCGHISMDNVQYINPPDNAEARRTKVQDGDLLISITADLGRTGVVTKEIAEKGAYINQHLMCVRLNKKILLPEYVSFFMESQAGKRQFYAKNQNAVKAGLNFDAIKTFKIMVPPLEKQNEYISFTKRVSKSKVISSTFLPTHPSPSESASQVYAGSPGFPQWVDIRPAHTRFSYIC